MKNLSKRMKNAIIQGFIFNLVVAFLFIIALFTYIIPNYREVSLKKQELSSVTKELKSVESIGIPYEEFKSTAEQEFSKNTYLKSILKELDENFYKQNFENTGSGSYEEFLKQKNQEILDIKSSEDYNQRLQLLSQVLPFYGDAGDSIDSISDFEFINNIENILFSFNLISNDPIGIRSLDPVSFGELTPTEDGGTEASMYAITVPLSLVGQKKDILDFLHYVENVGKIEIENGVLKVYEDSYFTRFPGNIYKGQVADIESIIFPEYIDNSPDPTSTDLVTFINTTQAREKYNINISLRFYVAGLPKYKIESFIQDLVEKNTEVSTRLGIELKKYQALFQNSDSGDAISTINEMRSLNFLLQEITAKVGELQRKQFEPGVALDEIYKEAGGYKERLTKIEDYSNKYIQKLETIR